MKMKRIASTFAVTICAMAFVYVQNSHAMGRLPGNSIPIKVTQASVEYSENPGITVDGHGNVTQLTGQGYVIENGTGTKKEFDLRFLISDEGKTVNTSTASHSSMVVRVHRDDEYSAGTVYAIQNVDGEIHEIRTNAHIVKEGDDRWSVVFWIDPSVNRPFSAVYTITAIKK
jgi:hypothetical protein